ncbi:chloramphenicol resistance protein [Xylaria bambusicola]|uniref:chloramphenicol resistance protein n=1 Tax=Xylaria bambusicola TaxID=326684 RepID=UPI002007ADAB|nr:chloramphenicol resistance protein [Xylaria bambusicola]KAI0508671.1 chloramphenicol resistance protein [Xylaria bambusicola]
MASTRAAAEPRDHEDDVNDSDLDIQEGIETSSHSQDEKQDQDRDLENTLSRVSSGPPYTVFSHRMKWWIVGMNSISAFISPITGNIYFPAIPTLATDLGVGVDRINLTLTTYMIFQALAPTIFGDFGDIAGRRPAFIIAFTIYLGANIGLALQRSYAALLVLRMIQSGGSSGTIALVYAVVADIAPSSERGKWMGIVGSGITIGPAIGPGGLINAYLGWPWIFWFLIILTVVWLIPYILAVPETARKVVGNGSIPPRGWNMSLIDYLRFRKQPVDQTSTRARQRIPIPNPLNTLKVLRHKDMIMILIFNAALFTCFSTVTATLASQFGEIYGYDELTLGLLYLPIGGSTTIASIGGGFVADWNFRRIARKMGVNMDRKRGVDLADFPVEKARIQLILPLLLIGAGATTGYGWALERQTSVAVPLVLSFFIGICVTWPFQIMNLLVIDLYPTAPATATAANNLCRCILGAASTASIEYIIRGIGRGWAFTILALLFTIQTPSLFIIQKHGPRWRKERIQRSIEEAEKKKTEVDERVAGS